MLSLFVMSKIENKIIWIWNEINSLDYEELLLQNATDQEIDDIKDKLNWIL